MRYPRIHLADFYDGVAHAGNALAPYRERADLDGVLARRTAPDAPWLIELLEPLPTHAPSPSRCQPHCCFLDTVIFYHRPYIGARERPSRWSDGSIHRGSIVFAAFDRVRARLRLDDWVTFDGDTFRITSGRAIWARRRWWMLYSARRDAAVVPFVRADAEPEA